MHPHSLRAGLAGDGFAVDLGKLSLWRCSNKPADCFRADGFAGLSGERESFDAKRSYSYHGICVWTPFGRQHAMGRVRPHTGRFPWIAKLGLARMPVLLI
jgi:hypothetical protein